MRGRRHILAGFAALMALTCPPAAAWNAAGHRLTATVAWRLLDAPTRDCAGRLLAAHPGHADWLQRARETDSAHAAFVEASTWADDIRSDPRFHDEDEAATLALAGYPDMQRHRRWHHADRPLVDGSAAHPVSLQRGGELDLAVPKLLQTLADRRAGDAPRAYALAWLIHLVGDAHQPLHAVSRYNAAGQGDEGGNALRVATPLHPRRHEMTLHAYWDDLPGPPWLRGARLEAAAERLLTLGGAPDRAGGIGDWLDESRQLAAAAAYADLDGEPPSIGAAYNERALRTARERVALAGKRLALLLRQTLATCNSSEQRTPRR